MENKVGFLKGLDRDSSVSKRDPNSYYDALNIRVLTDDGISTGSITNEKGNELLFKLPDALGSIYTLPVTPTGSTLTVITSLGTYDVSVGASSSIVDNYNEILADSNVIADIETGLYNVILNNNLIYFIGFDSLFELSYTLPILTKIVEPTSGFKIIGLGTMRDWVVIFTTDIKIENTYSIPATIGNGQIWKCKYNQFNEVIEQAVAGVLVPSIHLVYNGILGFNKSYRVGEVISRYQDSTHGKIFFVDGLNTMKHINILDPNSLALPLSSIDVAPDVALTQPKATSVIKGGGLKSGSIQYSYQLFNQGGNETTFAPASALAHLTISNEYSSNTLDYKGTAPSTDVGKAVKVSIDGLDTNFDYIRLISLYYSSQEASPEVYIVEEKPVPPTGSIEFTDDGNNIGVYSVTEYNTTGTRNFIPKTIATKNNYLIAANIKEEYFDFDELYDWDSRTYRWNDAGQFRIDGVDSNNTTVSPTADCVLTRTEQETYKYNPVAATPCLGGKGINIHYEFTVTPILIDSDSDDTKVYAGKAGIDQKWGSIFDTGFTDNDSYTSYASPLNKQLVGYTRDEIYRFGIVFYDGKGRQSFVKWIADIKFPSIRDTEDTKETYNIGGVSHNDYNTVTETADGIYGNVLGIKFTVTDVPTGLTYRVVRVRREQSDKYILGQGLMGVLSDADGTYVHPYNHSIVGASKYDTTNNYFSGYTDMLTFKSPEVLFTDSIKPVQGDLLETIGYCSSIAHTAGTKIFINKLKNNVAMDKYNAVIKDGIKAEDTEPINVDYSYVIQNDGLIERLKNHRNAYKGSMLALGLSTPFDVGSSVAYPVVLNYTKSTDYIQYGGNSYYDRVNSVYEQCGNLMGDGNTVTYVFGGDTYIGMFEYLNAMTYKDSPSSDSENGEIIFVPLETTINLDLNHGTSYSKDTGDYKLCETVAFGNSTWQGNNYPADYTDIYQYNLAYSVEPNGKSYTVKPLFFQNNQVNDYRGIVSEKHINNQLNDSWTKFLYNNLIEVNSAYGSINKIITFRNRLFFFQDNAFGILGFEDRQLLKDNTGLPLTLGTGGILSNYQYISEKTGCKSKFGVVDTGSYLYFVDLNNRKFMRFDGNTDQCVSDKDNMSSFFRTFDYGNTLLYDEPSNYIGIHGVFDPINKRVLYTMFGNEFIVGTEEVESIEVKYGALYNWYAATDVRGISSGDGWVVPTYLQWYDLINYVTESTIKLSDTNTDYWVFNPLHIPTNEYALNLRGSGIRDYFSDGEGGFYNYLWLKYRSLVQVKDSNYISSDSFCYLTIFGGEQFFSIEVGDLTTNKNAGLSIRLFRPATITELLQSDGTPCSNYTGNDGKVYRTVKIGTQVWLADNLCETKFADGTTIPLVTSDVTWAALTTAGMCYYDNDIANAYTTGTAIVNTYSNGKTLSFNEVVDGFESFYSFVPTIYENTDFGVLSINPNDLGECYLHTKGNRGVFYGTAYNSYLTHILAPNPDNKKVFTNLEFNSYVEVSGVDVPLETINTIQLWNSFQDTGVVTLTHPTNLRRRFRTWRYQLPRVSNVRLMDYSLFTKFLFTNSLTEDKYFRLDDITIHYLVPMI